MSGHWQHVEHDADIGLRVTATTREEVFELAGEALTAIICDPAAVRATETVTVRCEAPDNALLFVDWLNALIYEMATRRMLFANWRIELDGHTLEATIQGEAVDGRRHRPVVEVKGATYTALEFEQAGDGTWHAQCVVDV